MRETAEFSTIELPDWMRRARRRFDFAIFIVIGLGMIAAWPFIHTPNVSRTNDTEHHVFRGTDAAQAIQEGMLYPRWSANALGGYGAPIPNYSPPGAAYLTAIIETAITDDVLLAVRSLYAGSIIVAGLAVYWLCSVQMGSASALFSSALYMFSPPIALQMPHLHGDLPGSLAAALLPLMMWAAVRLLDEHHPLDTIFVSLTAAALGFTAPIHLMIGVLFVLGRSMWLRAPTRRVLRLVIGLALGFGLAGCFWIPAILEQNTVTWMPALLAAQPQSVSLIDLLQPLRAVDPQALLSVPQHTLGWLQIGFAISGVITAKRYHLMSWSGTFVTALILLVIAQLIAPTNTNLTLPMSFCLAVIGGISLKLRDRLPKRWRRLTLPSLLILLWIASNPIWLIPVTEDVFGETDAAAQVQYEKQGYGIASLPAGDPIPVSLTGPIAFNRSLIEGYISGNVNKIAPGQITSSTQISLLAHETHQDRFQVQRVLVPITLNFLTAYFPGWEAKLDNRLISLRSNPETGLIQVDLPAVRSSQELVIRLKDTPERELGWVISGVSAAILVAFFIWEVRNPQHHPKDIVLLSQSDLRLNGLVLVIIGLVTLVLSFTPFGTTLTARPGYGLDGAIRLPNRTDSGLSLIAFALQDNLLEIHDRVELELFWQAQRVLSENFRVRVTLINNQDGTRWFITGFRHPGYYPTSRWNTRQYVHDHYDMKLPENIEAGNYQINIEVQDCIPTCNEGNSLTFFDGKGQAIGSGLTLPTLLNISP